jgi:hypothetical protein
LNQRERDYCISMISSRWSTKLANVCGICDRQLRVEPTTEMTKARDLFRAFYLVPSNSFSGLLRCRLSLKNENSAHVSRLEQMPFVGIVI